MVGRNNVCTKGDLLVCCICHSDKFKENNRIVLCAGESCNRAYHQWCHFVPLLIEPRGRWLCIVCRFNKEMKESEIPLNEVYPAIKSKEKNLGIKKFECSVSCIFEHESAKLKIKCLNQSFFAKTKSCLNIYLSQIHCYQRSVDIYMDSFKKEERRNEKIPIELIQSLMKLSIYKMKCRSILENLELFINYNRLYEPRVDDESVIACGSAMCCICFSCEEVRENPVLLCDSEGCNRAIHRRCNYNLTRNASLSSINGQDVWFCFFCTALNDFMKLVQEDVTPRKKWTKPKHVFEEAEDSARLALEMKEVNLHGNMRIFWDGLFSKHEVADPELQKDQKDNRFLCNCLLWPCCYSTNSVDTSDIDFVFEETSCSVNVDSNFDSTNEKYNDVVETRDDFMNEEKSNCFLEKRNDFMNETESSNSLIEKISNISSLSKPNLLSREPNGVLLGQRVVRDFSNSSHSSPVYAVGVVTEYLPPLKNMKSILSKEEHANNLNPCMYRVHFLDKGRYDMSPEEAYKSVQLFNSLCHKLSTNEISELSSAHEFFRQENPKNFSLPQDIFVEQSYFRSFHHDSHRQKNFAKYTEEANSNEMNSDISLVGFVSNVRSFKTI